MSEMENANKHIGSGIYGSAMGTLNGHIPQNYYLTGDGTSDPSPNGSNETQTEFWNTLKSANMMQDVTDNDIHAYNNYKMIAAAAAATANAQHQMLDPNGYLNAYGYYPQQNYQQLGEEHKAMSMLLFTCKKCFRKLIRSFFHRN